MLIAGLSYGRASDNLASEGTKGGMNTDFHRYEMDFSSVASVFICGGFSLAHAQVIACSQIWLSHALADRHQL